STGSPAGPTDSAKETIAFSSSTSLHGVARATSAQSRAQRAFWMMVVVAGVAMAGWQVALRLAAYYAWPTSTSLTLHYVRDLSFPAVTFCNYNRYRRSSLHGTTDLLAALSILSAGIKTPHPEYLSGFLWRITLRGYSSPPITQTYSARNQDLSTTILEIDDTYCENSCTPQDFQHVFTEYGNCYTFNGGFSEEQRSLKQKTAGAGKGLQVLFDVQQKSHLWDYWENPELGFTGVGIRLVVHDPDEPPQVEALGLSIGVGTQAYVSVQHTKSINQQYPWGDCDPSKKLQSPAPYSMARCLQECEADLVERICGCKPFNFPGDIKECSLYQHYHCARDALVIFLAQGMCTGGSHLSQCPVPCLHKNFPSSVSYATFPSLQAAQRYERSLNYSLVYMRENLLSIDVAYTDLNYALIQQQKTLPESVLLSDIGGQLGLFVGASVITIIEVLEFVARSAARALNAAASFLSNRAATCTKAALSPPVQG
uniref:Acid sensing ion channel subunit family member 5 n=1 Tax=Petromyzon marinus TaxID=7757 RepID=S4RS34_PETMA